MLKRPVTLSVFWQTFSKAAWECKAFVKYVGKKKDKCKEGIDCTHQELMNLAANKFKILKQAKKWNALSPQKEKILMLQAKVVKLERKPKGGSKDSQKRSKSEKGKARKRESDFIEKPAWMFKEPKAAELKEPKAWNKKKWLCCSPKTGGKCNQRCATPASNTQCCVRG